MNKLAICILIPIVFLLEIIVIVCTVCIYLFVVEDNLVTVKLIDKL